MSTQASSIRIPSKPALGGILKAGLIGGVIAAGINTILLLLAGIFGIALTVLAGSPPNQQQMSLEVLPVVLFSIVPAIIGALLYFVLTRITGKAAMIFTVIAVIVVLLSLLPIFGQPLSAAGMIVLVLMHVVAGGVVTYWLTRRTA